MVHRNINIPDVYVGFRVRESFDADLDEAYASKTTVYTWEGSTFSDYFETYRKAAISTGNSYYEPLSGLTTRQLSITADGGSAVVSICRNTSTVETAATCNNGLDDDCDGLIDAADPDCGFVKGTPSASNLKNRPPPPPTAGPLLSYSKLHP